MAFNGFCKFCLILSSFCFVGSLSKKATDGFSISAISSKRPYAKEYETRPPTAEEDQEIQKALSQPYTYFGRGGQAFAFFSSDGKYVLKFFKQSLFRKNHLLNVLPLPPFFNRYRWKKNWKRADKLRRDFSSYRASLEELGEETGVLLVHLNKTEGLNPKLPIIDCLHLHHTIDLNRFDFVLQKKAERVYERIDKQMQAGDLGGAEQTIRSVLELISHRCKKGFRDRDPDIRTNCGFLGDRAIKIDVGRFVKCEEMRTKEMHNLELELTTQKFGDYLKVFHPQLVSVLETQREEAMIP